MASADYLFRISLDASQAMVNAKTFAKQLQKELGNIKVKPINITTAGKQFAGYRVAAGRVGADAGNLLGKQMNASFQRYQTTAARAQMSIGAPLMGALETAIERPTAASIRSVDTLTSRLKAFDQEVGRMGFTAGQWQNASWMQQRMGVLQAAQRQVWGIRGMGVQAQMYGRGMMAAGAGGLGAAGMAAKEYAQFAEPLGRAARNLELNNEMTKELDASLRSLAGTASVFSPEEQAAGLYQWAAATGEVVDSTDDLDTLLTRTGEVQKLASLGMVGYGTSVAAVTDILSQFQLNVTETDRVVATLVKVAAVSKAEVTDLAEAFKYAGTYAHQTNTTFSETAGIFQLLSSYGQRGSMAGRGMARLMEGLIAPSQQAQKEMDKLFKTAFGRTDVLTNAEGKFIGMANAVKVLAQATENLTEADRASFVAKITTQNAARVLLPLLGSEIEARKLGISAIEENIKIIEGQADVHTQTYVKMMKDVYGYTVSVKSAAQTMSDQWNQFLESTDGRVKMTQASMQGAIVSIGASVMQTALPAMEKLADVMRGIAAFAETHPGAIKGLLGGAAVTIAVGALVYALGKGLTLYADYKAIAMAVTFKTSVHEFGADVATFVAGVHEMSATQAYMMAGPSRAAGSAATATYLSAGAAKPTGVALGTLLGVAAAVTAATFAAALLVTKLETGRGWLDLMSTDAEATAAALEAAAEAADKVAKAEPGEKKQDIFQVEIARLKKEKEQWEEWLEMAERREAFGKKRVYMPLEQGREERRRLLEEVPEAYRPEHGIAEPLLLKQGLEEVNAELKTYNDLLGSAKIEEGLLVSARADAVLMMRLEAAALKRIQGALPEALRGPVYEDPVAMMTRVGEAADFGPGIDWAAAVEDVKLDRLYELAEVLGLDADAMKAFLQSMAGFNAEVLGLSGTSIQNAIAMLREFGQAVPTEMQLVSQIGTSAQGAWGKAKGLQAIGWSTEDIVSTYDAYLTGLERVTTAAEGMTNWQAELYIQAYDTAFSENVQGNIDMHSEMKKNAEQAIKDQQQMYEKAAQGLRGYVEAALTPTQVTAEDVAATQAGDYIDKWDEEVRRMKAAMAGSARWKEMIPEGVWAKGADAAKGWGQSWIKQFYAGMKPDLIKWDPLLDSIENALAMAAGKRNLVEVVLQKLAEERGITATSEQVLAAMGMTGILPAGMLGPGVAGGIASSPQEFMDSALAIAENVVGPLGEQLGQMDLSDQAQSLLQQLNKGIGDKKDTIKWCDQFKKSITKDISENKGQLKDAGVLIGNALWDGVYQAFEDANIVWVIAHKVIAIINAEKANSSTANRAGGPQP